MPKKRGKMVHVDFTGVEAGGGGRLLPEEQFKFEVEEVTQETSEDSGKDYLSFKLKVADGEYEGTAAYDNMSLQPQALWKLRGFMEAAGMPTEDGPMEIDPEEFTGMIVMGDVIHEDYKGKAKHRINSYSPVEEETTAAAPASSTARRKPAKAADGEDSDWKVKQKVAFMDGKKKLEGTITEIDGTTVTVRVGKEEYEMETSDLLEA
jgi:Protein of unknown function (DUF669)